jgi:uncharacterized protein YccT (UPF0319 family)
MIRASITVSSNYSAEIKKYQKQLATVPQEALSEFVALTPVDSGNARRNTSLHGNTIEANYPYAQRLDQGWSKQAPNGMTKPFEKWLEKKFKTIFGK